MAGEFIITGGDFLAQALIKSKIGAAVLVWRDVLHQGPVPPTDDLADFSAQRVVFLKSMGWSAHLDLTKLFGNRNASFLKHGDFARVQLWSEPDAYDQLQLLQLIDLLARSGRKPDTVDIVACPKGASQMWSAQLQSLAKKAAPLTSAQVALAQKAWAAYRQPTPEAWAALLNDDLSALPALKPVVARLLEELPHPRSGLGRVEQQIVSLVANRVRKPKKLFSENATKEPLPFVGDWSFYAIMERLTGQGAPLLEGLYGGPFRPEINSKDPYFTSELRLTKLGEAVHAGTDDYTRHATIDRWWGGTHLTNDKLWRWDVEKGRLLNDS